MAGVRLAFLGVLSIDSMTVKIDCTKKRAPQIRLYINNGVWDDFLDELNSRFYPKRWAFYQGTRCPVPEGRARRRGKLPGRWPAGRPSRHLQHCVFFKGEGSLLRTANCTTNCFCPCLMLAVSCLRKCLRNTYHYELAPARHQLAELPSKPHQQNV